MSETLIPLLGLFSKLLVYLGSAAVIGGWFSLMLIREQPELSNAIRRYILTGVLLALVAVAMNFFAQVGSFAESGWGGLFDAMYVAMLWDSPVGSSVVFRICALSLMLCASLLASRNAFNASSLTNSDLRRLLLVLIAGTGSLLLAFSYSLIGHTAELDWIARLLISLHVLIALGWIGSLLPLWQACRDANQHNANPEVLQQLMYRFGRIAMGLVAVLLVCGVVLAYQLLGSVSELISTPYGLLLLAKMGLVAVMLSFAVWHKWRLVPQLTDQAAVLRLQRSILLEGLTGLSILLVTILLTTVVGPDAVH
ncbi:MAG: copper resistance D family protein [Thiolinea sp.]